MAELRGGTTIAGYTAIHSGLKEAYLGGNLTINGNALIHGTLTMNSDINMNSASNININQAGYGITFGEGSGARGFIRRHASSGQIEFGSDDKFDFIETDSSVLAVQISANNKTVNAIGGFLWNGQSLDSRYVNVTDNYVDTDLDGRTTEKDYPRLVANNSGASTPGWIRVGNSSGQGLLPYANGVSNLGSSTWRFASIHGVTIYENGTALSSKFLGISAKAADSDKLDGLSSGSFLRSDANDQTGSTIKLWLRGAIGTQTTSDAALQVNGFIRTGNIYLHAGGNAPNDTRVSDTLSNDAGILKWRGYEVWNSSNDGSGSGLDADTVDGIHAGSFVRSDTYNTMNYSGGWLSNSSVDSGILRMNAGNNLLQIGLDGVTNSRRAYIQSRHNSSSYATVYGALHLNPLGGAVVVGDGGMKVNGQLEVFGSGGTTLDLVGTDHCYMEFYPMGTAAGRKAWFGFGSANSTRMTIQNTAGGDLELAATGGKVTTGGYELFHKNNITYGTSGSPTGGTDGNVYIQY
jgi:hypothetical protein